MLAKKCLLMGILTLFSVSLALADPPAVHPVTGEELVIDCFRGTPDAIDADLSDWNLEAMTPAMLDVAEQLHSGQDTWDGPDDCSGEFYMLWDDVNLYIAVVVKDDTLSTNKTDGNIWNADAVEVFFSTLNAVAGHSEHYQYGFTAANQRWNWCNIDGAGSIEPEYLQIAATDTADGYICEVSIEYAQMPSLDFSAGNTIGFHPVFDDTDNVDRELQMTWTGREAHDQSLGFGHMLLSADSVPEPEPVDPGNDGLGAYYALYGDATDSSGNGIDGIIHNADTGGLGDGGSVWVEDPERGTVISFNGTADGAHVRAGDIPQMTLTNDFTWSFWAKQDTSNTTPNNIILGNRMDENAVDFVPRQFIKFTPTKFEWHMNGNGDDNLDYDDIPADVWLHHAVVKTGDQLAYYRNGIEASSGIFTQPLDVPQPLFIGGDNEGAEGENWAGLMSDVSIYDRALSAGEVRYLAGYRAADVEANKEVARRFFEEMWNLRDLDIVEDLITADMQGHAPTGEFVGYEGERQTILGTLVGFPDLQITIDEMIAEDNKVALLTSYHGTHTGTLMGQIPATGTEIAMTGGILFRFVDGKVAEAWSYADMLGLMQQIGAAAPPRPLPEDYAWVPTSQVTGDPGDPETNKALVMRFIEEVWNQHNLDPINELFHPEIIGNNPSVDPHIAAVEKLNIGTHPFSDADHLTRHLMAMVKSNAGDAGTV